MRPSECVSVSERVAGDTGGGPVTLQGTVWAWSIFSSIILTDTKHLTFDKKMYKMWGFGVQLIEMPRFDVLTHLEFSVFGFRCFRVFVDVDSASDWTVVLTSTTHFLSLSHSLTHSSQHYSVSTTCLHPYNTPCRESSPFFTPADQL